MVLLLLHNDLTSFLTYIKNDIQKNKRTSSYIKFTFSFSEKYKNIINQTCKKLLGGFKAIFTDMFFFSLCFFYSSQNLSLFIFLIGLKTFFSEYKKNIFSKSSLMFPVERQLLASLYFERKTK